MLCIHMKDVNKKQGLLRRDMPFINLCLL